jgi:hemolysin III
MKDKQKVYPTFYTKGEEIFNMASHIAGGGLGVIALVLCVVFAALYGNAWGVVGSAIYGASLVTLYAISSIYHGLHVGKAKHVLRVLDHCMIYFLIGGSYTPILLCAVRPVSPGWAWVLFGIVWGLAALATTFTAINLEKYKVLSMVCYIGMGWSVILAMKTVFESIALPGFILLLAGGIVYSIGAVFYAFGSKCRYIHSVFHLFVVLGSILQFLCIFFFVI